MATAVTAVMIAVLASAYRTYSVRAEVVAGIRFADAAKQLVADEFRRTGEIPPDRRWEGPPQGPSDPLNVVASLAINRGRVDVTYGDTAHDVIAGRFLSLTPYETADLRIVWVCGNRAPEVGLQPLGFAGGSRQPIPIPTTIEDRFLPPSCR
jgi:hypothetical protein